MKKALITGIAGQIGSYLTELLLEKNYIVYGLVRNLNNTSNICHFQDKIKIFVGDITDSICLVDIFNQIKTDLKDYEILEIYNLAGQSSIKISFDLPYQTMMSNAIGTLNILESVRILHLTERVKILQAASSELFGESTETPQTESTGFYPKSPYGVSKLCSYWIARNYRETYNLFVSSAIIFNNSSPRTPPYFIIKKIALGAVAISKGTQDCMYLGNINAKRDIGYSPDYCEAMHLMLQQKESSDFVIATGKQYSIREIVEVAFKIMNIELAWKGYGLNEVGYDKNNNKIYIRIDEKYFRPLEVNTTVGNNNKAQRILGWKPKVNLEELFRKIITEELKKI